MDSYDFILITLLVALIVLIFVGSWFVVGIVVVFVFVFAMYWVFLYYKRKQEKVVIIKAEESKKSRLKINKKK